MTPCHARNTETFNSACCRAPLRKAGFCWQRNGEALLRRRKKTFFDGGADTQIHPIGDRLAELLRTGR